MRVSSSADSSAPRYFFYYKSFLVAANFNNGIKNISIRTTSNPSFFNYFYFSLFASIFRKRFF